MREIRLPEGLHVGHAVRPPPGPIRPPYLAKYELGVVFWHVFVRVSTPKGVRPPLPINIKGHGRLKGISAIESIKLIFYRIYLSVPLYPTFSNPMCCSSTTSAPWEDVLAGLPSLGQTKVRLPPTGSLPGERSLVSRQWTRRPRSNRPCLAVWPPYVEALLGAPPRACWLRKGVNNSQPFFIEIPLCRHVPELL
jgi:hypothetical protein